MTKTWIVVTALLGAVVLGQSADEPTPFKAAATSVRQNVDTQSGAFLAS